MSGLWVKTEWHWKIGGVKHAESFRLPNNSRIHQKTTRPWFLWNFSHTWNPQTTDDRIHPNPNSIIVHIVCCFKPQLESNKPHLSPLPQSAWGKVDGLIAICGTCGTCGACCTSPSRWTLQQTSASDGMQGITPWRAGTRPNILRCSQTKGCGKKPMDPNTTFLKAHNFPQIIPLDP